jgi:hypothetical protein
MVLQKKSRRVRGLPFVARAWASNPAWVVNLLAELGFNGRGLRIGAINPGLALNWRARERRFGRLFYTNPAFVAAGIPIGCNPAGPCGRGALYFVGNLREPKDTLIFVDISNGFRAQLFDLGEVTEQADGPLSSRVDWRIHGSLHSQLPPKWFRDLPRKRG